jgi:hypothetical protein
MQTEFSLRRHFQILSTDKFNRYSEQFRRNSGTSGPHYVMHMPIESFVRDSNTHSSRHSHYVMHIPLVEFFVRDGNNAHHGAHLVMNIPLQFLFDASNNTHHDTLITYCT